MGPCLEKRAAAIGLPRLHRPAGRGRRSRRASSREGKTLDLADLGGDREGEHPADPRRASTAAGCRGDRRRSPAAACSTSAICSSRSLDQRAGWRRYSRATAPGTSSRASSPRAFDPEEIGDRARPPEADQGRVDPVLQHRSGASPGGGESGRARAPPQPSGPEARSPAPGRAARARRAPGSRSCRSSPPAAPVPSPSGRRRSRPTSLPFRGCRGRSWRRSSTRSPRRPAGGGCLDSIGEAPQAAGVRVGRRAVRGALRRRQAGRRQGAFD